MRFITLCILAILPLTRLIANKPNTVTPRPALVTQAEGSPVALEGSKADGDRLHARATVRNLTTNAVTSLTFVTTVGDPAAETAVRSTETVSLTLEAGATAVVALRGITPATVEAVLPDVPRPLVELAVIGATSSDGRRWRLQPGPRWFGLPDRRLTLQCLTPEGAIVAAGEIVAGHGICQTDGTFAASPGGGNQ